MSIEAREYKPFTPKFKSNIMEADILAAIMRVRDITATYINEINRDFFEDRHFRLIFNIIHKYWDKHREIPTDRQIVSFIEKFCAKSGNSTDEYIEKFKNEVLARPEFQQHEIDSLGEELTQFIRNSKVYMCVQEAIVTFGNDEEFNAVVERMREATLWKIDDDIGIEISDIASRYDRAAEAFSNPISIPFPKLQEYIGGGLFRKTVTCLTAGTGIGKSIMLDQIGFYAWHILKKNVITFSLELSEEMKSLRIDSQFLGKKIRDLVENKQVVLDAYGTIGKHDNKFYVKDFPPDTVSSKHLMDFLKKLHLHTGFVPDLIIIDHADHMVPVYRNRNTNSYDKGDQIFKQLKAMAHIYDLPVLTATQLQREVGDMQVEDIFLRHVSESKAKNDNTDNMIVIGGTPAQRALGQVQAKGLKCRMGQVNFIVDLVAEYECFRFYEAE